jgi:2-haloacid dehalogenase
MHYQWLVFDADNTLLDFHRSARAALAEALRSIGLNAGPDYFETYHAINLECWADLEAGRISPEELKTIRFSRFFEEIGVEDGDPGQLNSLYFEALKESAFCVEGAVEILELLHRAGFAMAIATNGLAEVQRPRLERAGLDRFFREIIVSEEIGYFKPNPGFFHIAMQRMQAKKGDRLLMIGDSLHSDVEGARRAGWDTCWFNPNGGAAETLPAPNFIISRLDQLWDILN